MRFSGRLILTAILVLLLSFSLLSCDVSAPPGTQSSPYNQKERKTSPLFEKPAGFDETTQLNYQRVYPGNEVDTSSLVLGLNAATSGDFSRSGISIWRGMVLAVDAINERGGLLGRRLQILVKDHRANPIRGRENLRQFAGLNNLLAVVGGMHTPVLLSQLETIHKKQVLSLVPWAAGSGLVENGYDPNYVFRLSLNDRLTASFIAEKLSEAGYRNPVLVLENTAWGRSNHRALTRALEKRDVSAERTLWFNWGEQSFTRNFSQILDTDADVVVFVGNAPEGAALVRSLADFDSDQRLPVVSHWGITGGRFYQETSDVLPEVKLRVVQTRGLLGEPDSPVSRRIVKKYCEKFSCDPSGWPGVVAPNGTAHAYDLVRILARATVNAGTANPARVREQLQELRDYTGVVRSFNRPFAPDDHEALSLEELRLVKFTPDGTLVPEGLK